MRGRAGAQIAKIAAAGDESMSETNPKTRSDTALCDKQETAEPPLYRVLLLNDDYTTMEFVVKILQDVFRKSHDEATKIMLSVHRHGTGLAGVYVKQIAETKCATVHRLARAEGFPLRCAMEPE